MNGIFNQLQLPVHRASCYNLKPVRATLSTVDELQFWDRLFAFAKSPATAQ